MWGDVSFHVGNMCPGGYVLNEVCSQLPVTMTSLPVAVNKLFSTWLLGHVFSVWMDSSLHVVLLFNSLGPHMRVLDSFRDIFGLFFQWRNNGELVVRRSLTKTFNNSN
jgi:hypothetical protein